MKVPAFDKWMTTRSLNEDLHDNPMLTQQGQGQGQGKLGALQQHMQQEIAKQMRFHQQNQLGAQDAESFKAGCEWMLGKVMDSLQQMGIA